MDEDDGSRVGRVTPAHGPGTGRRLPGHGAGLLRVPGGNPPAMGRDWRRDAGPGRSRVTGSVRGDLRAGRRPPPGDWRATGGSAAAGHGTGDLGAQERGRAGRDRSGRAHAPDHGRRAGRHPQVPGPGHPPGRGQARSIGRDDRNRRARLRPHPPRHFKGGDPSPNDHVLLANLVQMLDRKGGWKAADTALWREYLHAATMVGRVVSARVAVELGYAIEADPGPSGRLRHWRIAGVPDEVIEVHSKRAAEIDAECQPSTPSPDRSSAPTPRPRSTEPSPKPSRRLTPNSRPSSGQGNDRHLRLWPRRRADRGRGRSRKNNDAQGGDRGLGGFRVPGDRHRHLRAGSPQPGQRGGPGRGPDASEPAVATGSHCHLQWRTVAYDGGGRRAVSSAH
jgi:TrwC relaxase